MLRAMRVLYLNEEEYFFYKRDVEIVSIRNEGTVLETLSTLFSQRLNVLQNYAEESVLLLDHRSFCGKRLMWSIGGSQ